VFVLLGLTVAAAGSIANAVEPRICACGIIADAGRAISRGAERRLAVAARQHDYGMTPPGDGESPARRLGHRQPRRVQVAPSRRPAPATAWRWEISYAVLLNSANDAATVVAEAPAAPRTSSTR
jgi:hypothetical protein